MSGGPEPAPRLRRRVTAVAIVGLLFGGPAAALRAACAWGSCERLVVTEADIPFCSLPRAIRSEIANGYYEGRSPDVLAVTRRPVVGDTTRRGEFVAWPSTTSNGEGRVPIVFSGVGVRSGMTLPEGTGLKDIAPTIARLIGLKRAHPDVRSGREIQGVAFGNGPRLVLELVLRGVSAPQLEARRRSWPTLARLLEAGAGTLDGRVGSLPVDPAAAVATIGTGGLPRDHGIVGPIFRTNVGYDASAPRPVRRGTLVRAGGKLSPDAAIATLAEDLDHAHGEKARIGLVGAHLEERGLVGGDWYSSSDREDVVILEGASSASVVRVAREQLASGFGVDDVPDLMVVSMTGRIDRLDDGLRRLMKAARVASSGSVAVVVIGTGRLFADSRSAARASRIVDRVELSVGGSDRVVAAAVAGGLYLDQETMAATEVSDDEVIGALMSAEDGKSRKLVADSFGGLAVALARYC